MSQNEAILRHLKRGYAIEPMQAYSVFHCLRLAARIADLRALGHRIERTMVYAKGKHWAQYRLQR